MPSGVVHRKVTYALAVGAGIVTTAIAGPVEGVAIAAGVTATVAVHPDLDIVDATWRSKRTTPLVLWWLFWLPYARSMRHRSPLSHWPIVSTIVRVIYLLAIPISILAVAAWSGADLEWLYSPIGEYGWVFRVVLLGMCMSDTLHWMLDKGT